MAVALLQAVVTGVLVGGIYACMAVGLSVVFGVMNILNIAHAAFALLSAYLAFWAFKLWGVDPILSLLGTVPILLALGAGTYQAFIRPIRNSPPLMSLLLLFGLAHILEGGMLLLWSGDYRSINTSYTATSFALGELTLSTTRSIGFVASALVVGGLSLFLKRSYLGKAIRATMQEREAALLMGVDIDHVSRVAFLLGIATAAVGGTFLGLVYAFYPYLHFLWIGRLFAIVVLGGMGSVAGALAGSIVLGVAESVTASLTASVWSELVAYAILVLTLLLRPSGLFGRGR
jgi:branched-chain amino acid transport system permease protein